MHRLMHRLSLRDVGSCREYAAMMRHFAELVSDPGAKAKLLANADEWDRLADKHVASAEQPRRAG